MQYVKIDQPLDLVNVFKGSGSHYNANSPAPLRVCWGSSKPFEQFKHGDILAITTGIVKPKRVWTAAAANAGKNHTQITIHYALADNAEEPESVISLSCLLETARRGGKAKGGFSGVPRKPDFGEGEKMEAKTISLPPSYWAYIDQLPGRNRSEKIRLFVDNNSAILLGKLPT